MSARLIAIDTNVIVAALAEAHDHHAPSLALFSAPGCTLAVAAHCYAEAFATLTRRGDHAPFHWPADEAWAALESVAAASRLIGLSPAQGFDAVREFAAAGHIGARLYDHLIACAAVVAGAEMLVTWNIGHFRSLNPGIALHTPQTALTG